ncbi:TolC family protein [Luteolibacter sp. AS25]|uniref:TolC family protein n=1 Tax=Luteolibacter sp. AS25 TaxID=3135776 RepID=UPI00398A7CA1
MKFQYLPEQLSVLLVSLVLASCADTAEGPSGSSAYSASEIPAEKLSPRIYSVGSGSPDKLAELAAQHNPAIVALRYRAERMEAKVPQEAALPDPMASISGGSMAETAAGRVEGMVGASQKIPLPGKRNAASRAASHEAAAVRAEADAMALKVSEQVKSAWWDYYLAEQTISFTRENRGLLSSIKEIIATRIEADSAAQADQLRIDNEISILDRDLKDLEKVRSSSKARINSLLNRPAGSTLPSPRAPSIPATSSLDSLIARAEATHPDINAAEQRVSAFNERLRKAKLERFPDPTVGVTYSPVSGSGLAGSSNGRDQVFATLGFNIPLWQEPRRAMVREASAGIAETEALLQSSRAEIRYRVEDAYFRAKTAREVTALYQDRLIPSAKQAGEVTLTGYSSGESSFTDVIGTQREILTYQLQLIKSRAELGKAIATLEAAAAL